MPHLSLPCTSRARPLAFPSTFPTPLQILFFSSSFSHPSPSPAMTPPASELRAEYTNASAATTPSEPFALATPLPALPAEPSAPPTEYLRSLRGAVTSAQARINEALTLRMEEDKAREAAAAAAADDATEGGGAGKKNSKKNKNKKGSRIDEEAEELNYGEEVVEEED
ncbi:hypothetical protein TruAng_005173 [Truncatella angustata]|nr:hypothetical protein TruAng_005173 [Truncatella angustata]